MWKLKAKIADPESLPLFIERAHQILRHRFINTLDEEPFDLIGPEKRHRILNIYADSNEWVRSRWFPGRREFGNAEKVSQRLQLDWSVGDEIVDKLVTSGLPEKTVGSSHQHKVEKNA